MIHNIAKLTTKFEETWVFTPRPWEYSQLSPAFTVSISFESNGEKFSEFKVVQE